MNEPLLGRVLVENGHVTAEQLALALEKAGGNVRMLPVALVKTGAIRDVELAEVIARHGGFVRVDPRQANVDPDLLERLPQPKAVKLGVMPLEHRGAQTVRVAMLDPLELDTLRDVEFLLGKGVEPVVATVGELSAAIERHYGVDERLKAVLRGLKDDPRGVSLTVGEARARAVERAESGEEPTYVALLRFLLANARAARASDIHFEPQRDGLRVRYRVDGEMRDVMMLPRWTARGLVSRVKVIGGMDVANRLEPQEGKVRLRDGGKEVDARISVIPSEHGETCVMRLLDPDLLAMDLSDLGMSRDQLQMYYQLISQGEGVILVTGPTGSGKTTTLYATIHRLLSKQSSVVTVEDPIEYSLAGATQIQVDEHRGMGFSSAIRWLLRQDPDVLVVAEIRDKETAAAAFQAALTGHLVFATLHTRDAVGTISRLRDLGVPPYLVSATLLGVASQRLVRRLCPRCRVADRPDATMVNRAGLPSDALGATHVVGPGCAACGYTGYRGRQGVFEMLRLGDQLRSLIHGGADEQALRRAVQQGSYVSMSDALREKLASGATSLAEVLRHVDPVHFAAAERAPERPTAGTPQAPPSAAVRVDTTAPIEPPAAPAPPASAPDEPAPQPTVLVVDDSKEILDVVGYTLEGAGYRVLTAENGTGALETIERHRMNDPVHLVVLDVMMPDMSGFEVARRLRENIDTAFLPVLMLSARGEQSYIKEGLRVGADDYLPKPFDPEELELRVRALLRRAYRGTVSEAESA